MSLVRRLFLLGILVALVAVGYGNAQTQRQRSPGYVEIPVDGDFEQILKSLLAQVQSSEEFGDQLKQLIDKLKEDPQLLQKDSDEIERLKQQLRNDNPILRQRLQQWLKQGRGGGNDGVAIDPEKLAEFQKRLQSMRQDQGNRGGKVDPVPVPPPEFDPDIRPPQEEPPGPEEAAESESPWQKLLKEWGETLAKNDFLKSLGESESFQQLAMDLNELLSGGGGGDWLNSEDWSGWSELFGGEYWDEQAEWLGGMGVGEMFAFAKPSMGGLGTLDAKAADQAGSVLVVAALAIPIAAVVAIVGIYLLKRMGVSEILARKQRAAMLGPWPVDPHRLTSPEEVVVAFNYVTLLLCGLEAESWNHKQAVENLGRLKSRIDLAPLANLYERCRYDEADEWSPRDIESARRLLCQLAGG